jgi:hypothetical protein
LLKNLGGSLKIGYSHSFETKSEYRFSDNLNINNPKDYRSSITGLGLNYFINKKIAIYIDLETYFGGLKAKISRFIFDNNQYAVNNLINFGIKYNFKK